LTSAAGLFGLPAVELPPWHARYASSARVGATTSPLAANEPRTIYREESDRAHSFQVHAYVLMDSHFHLLVETPEANLGRAMQ
jgi:REP element-mobilizing transposase RayT